MTLAEGVAFHRGDSILYSLHHRDWWILHLSVHHVLAEAHALQTDITQQAVTLAHASTIVLMREFI